MIAETGWRFAVLGAAAVIVIILAACAKKPAQELASVDLAKLLIEEGLEFELAGKLDESPLAEAKIADSIIVRGADTDIEILRAADDASFSKLSGPDGLTAVGKRKGLAKVPDTLPPIITRKPYIIVVRAEPFKGAVQEAVERALNPQPKP